MSFDELLVLLNARGAVPAKADRAVQGVYTSDLLSDAIAHAPENGVLVTIQAHKNTVAVATLRDLVAIVICNNRQLPNDMLEAARSEGIGVAVTDLDQYTVSGRLYGLLGEADSGGKNLPAADHN